VLIRKRRFFLTPERKSLKKGLKERLMPSAVMASLIIIWEAAVYFFKIPSYQLPAPSAVFNALVSNRTILLTHSLVTLYEAILGFAAGTLLAVAISIVMSMSLNFKASIYPILVITQTVPLVAIAPLLAVWLGFGILPKIILSAIVVFFPVAVSTTEGLYSYDYDAMRLMKSMKATRWQVYSKLRIPGALPYFFMGLKTAAAYSIMGAVISEWTGAEKGLGIYLTRAMSSFRTAAMFADIFIIVILSIMLFKIVQYFEKRFAGWSKREEN
jgi:putative hydroxymethylpyrimidine transport system permease protein